MNVAILGTEPPSQIVAQIIEQNYNLWLERQGAEKLNVVTYVEGSVNTSNIGNIPILNLVQFALLYHKKVIDKIIFPREIFTGQSQILSQLMILGVNVDDVYITARLNDELNVFNFLEPYFSAKYLPYLEFHIADHCNLNCKYCEHYSGLVKEPKFPVLEKFAQDFQQLKIFIDDIGVIRILGGEPLLNPEINEYVKLSRQLYPYSEIYVVTNAILLPKMPDDFFETLKENNAAIWISFYQPMQSKMYKIQNLLKSKGVLFGISPLMKEFTVKQTLKRHDNEQEIFLQCFQSHCNNFYEGKIAACFLPFTTKYFNAYFNKNLPEDGALDLYEENLTTEKLKKFLITPFERCKYCTRPVAAKWEPLKYPSQITDWTNDHLIANS